MERPNQVLRTSTKDYSDLAYPETIPDSDEETSLSAFNTNMETTDSERTTLPTVETLPDSDEPTNAISCHVKAVDMEIETAPSPSPGTITYYEEEKNTFCTVTKTTTKDDREATSGTEEAIPVGEEQITSNASENNVECEITSIISASLKIKGDTNQVNEECEATQPSQSSININEYTSQDNTECKTAPSQPEISGVCEGTLLEIAQNIDPNVICETKDEISDSMSIDSNHLNEESYCSFTTIELVAPTFSKKTQDQFEEPLTAAVNGSNETENHLDENSKITVCNDRTKITDAKHNDIMKIKKSDDVEIVRNKKITTSTCDLISILESLYTIQKYPVEKVLISSDKFEQKVFVISQGAFCEHPEGLYLICVEEDFLHVKQEDKILLSLRINHAQISSIEKNVLKLDTRLGRCLYLRCDSEDDLMEMKEQLTLQSLKQWESECLKLVHYPLKCHKNIIIVDLGSCSTRAGILMDQPTLPSIFFPSVCAINKQNGSLVYGMEALQPEVRQNSTLSFPIRPSVKVTKHTIDIDLLGGLFKKIFSDLNIDQTKYSVQICLPRSLSINTQNALVKLLLEDLKVEAVSLANQALLTLYAHDVSTAIVVDIGDRMDILPVVDGFIVEKGVTKLPYGGQRLIHHMKHALAEKHISLSNEIDSYVVEYITENLSYIAEDYDSEVNTASLFPQKVRKTVTLPTLDSDSNIKQHVILDEACFKVPEGLFQPELWGLDCQGIHQLVHKAIQSTGVDARRKVTENIYISGGVTLLPGFVERLNKELTKLNKTKIKPKVFASNYRYHSTYIGACKFARKDVFPQVCVNLNEYSKNSYSSLKKFVLCV